MINAANEKRWGNLLSCSKEMIQNYPDTSFADEAVYYMGVAYFNFEDYRPANVQFTRYLKQKVSPKFFFEAINYKFEIAERLGKGKKFVRAFGWKKAPKIASGSDDAIVIYDEVISMIPYNEMSAKSYLGKVDLYIKNGEFPEAIEALEGLNRKFPQSDFAVQGYLKIASVYLMQVNPRHQDQDLLDRAELNLKHFKEAFPNEKRIVDAEKMLLSMKESYAKGLYEIALYYENNKYFDAAKIYYTKIASSFSGTECALLSQKGLERLKKHE